jgi:hypothetical protein
MLLVSRKLGLGLVPDRLLQRSPSRRLLRPLSVRGLTFPMTIWLLTAGAPPRAGTGTRGPRSLVALPAGRANEAAVRRTDHPAVIRLA